MSRRWALLLLLSACKSTPDTGAELPQETTPVADAAAAPSKADAGPELAPTDAGTLVTEDAGGPDGAAPGFDGTQGPLPADVRTHMTGRSWREGCPLGLDDLALLELAYWDFAGARQHGRLVVASSAAGHVLGAFHTLYDAHFPIARMRLVDDYEASDDLSMADDNTSAFNCRKVTGGSGWSAHSYGTAIDVNPRENPYVKGQTVLPPEGAEYLDRSSVRSGMAVEGSALVAAFDALGWGWGGRWASPRDYQHFSADDR